MNPDIDLALDELRAFGFHASYSAEKERFAVGFLVLDDKGDVDTYSDVSIIDKEGDKWVGWMIPGKVNLIMGISNNLFEVINAVKKFYEFKKIGGHTECTYTLLDLQFRGFITYMLDSSTVEIYSSNEEKSEWSPRKLMLRAKELKKENPKATLKCKGYDLCDLMIEINNGITTYQSITFNDARDFILKTNSDLPPSTT